MLAERDYRLLDNELRNERREVARLKTELKKQRTAHVDMHAAKAIFRYWVARLGKREKVAVFGEKRQKAVLARLTQYDAEYIARAIDGLAVGHYVSPDGKHYDDIELCCRDEVNLERFHEIAELRNAATMIGPAWLAEFATKPRAIS